MVFNKLIDMFKMVVDKNEPVKQQDPDIVQGLQYLKNKVDTVKVMKHKMNLIEQFQNRPTELWTKGQPSGDTIQEEYTKDLDEMKELENSFQKLLTEYSTTYKVYSEGLQKALTQEENKYVGRNVRDTTGNMYYITKFGETRIYPTDTIWKNRHTTCQSDYIQLTTTINGLNLPQGSPMKQTEPCGFEGSNVKMTDSTRTQYGYINKDGRLRSYPDASMKNTSGSCPTTVTVIDDSMWDAFQHGSTMGLNTLCSLGSVEPHIRQELVEINKQLMAISQKMYEKIETTQQKIQTDETQMTVETKYLNDQLARFKNLFVKMKQVTNKEATLAAMVEDSVLKQSSIKLDYLTWSILAGLAFLFTIRHVNSR